MNRHSSCFNKTKIFAELIAVFVLIGLFSFEAHSQQLDRIGKKDGINLTGGVGASGNAYFSDQPDQYPDPYSYVVSGDLNFDLYGFSVPLFFSYSNADFSHSGQPLNIIGLSPSYKDLTVHLGFRSMSFSTYTLSGHTFFGAGVEYSHKGFGIAAMGGRLLKAVEYDTAQPYNVPSYERWGEGVKLEYSKDGNAVRGIVFYAKDDSTSVRPAVDFSGFSPQENLVYSLCLERKLSDVISVNGEMAMSAWTKDLRDPLTSESVTARQRALFIDTRTSTQYYQAYKAGIEFGFDALQWGLGYERVEPGYHTLGAYNITNDFENISIHASKSFLEKKLSVNGSLGLQRDDLSGENMSTMNRVVGSLNSNYQVTERLSLNASYSGYNSLTKVKPVDDQYVQNTVFDQMDTMNMIQLTQSYNGGANYILHESDRTQHSISGNGGYQVADSKQGSTRFGTNMSNAMLAYSLTWKESGLNIGTSINSNLSEYEAGKSLYAGAGANAGVPVWQKRINVSLGTNLSNNYQDGTRIAMLYSVYNSYSLRFAKQHSINLSMRYSGRVKHGESEFGSYNDNVNEYTGTIGYRYTFQVKRKKPENS